MGGRITPERVAALLRNQWQDWAGIRNHSRIHRRVGRPGVESPRCIRPFRSEHVDATGRGDRTALCAAPGKTATSSGLIPRSRYFRVWGPVRVFRLTRTAALGRSPYHLGQGRTARASDRAKRDSAFQNPSCGVRRPSDRHRSRLPDSCCGTPPRANGRAYARSAQGIGWRSLASAKPTTRWARSRPPGVAV